jgi:hypothetical protein
MALSSSPREKLSFLFGGIGDACNLFQTILGVATRERESKNEEPYKNYHFTTVDIHSAAIARNLVMLLLLDELSELAHDIERAESSEILLCVFYTYVSLIMPNSLHGVLQEKIGEAKNALKKNTLPSTIEIPDMYRAGVIGCLDDWQREVQQEYPVTRLQPMIVETRRVGEESPKWWADLRPGSVAWREQRFEHETGAFVPFHRYNDLLDIGLREAFDEFGAQQSESAVRKAVRSIHDNWSTNPTLVDLTWLLTTKRDLYIDRGPCLFTDSIWGRQRDNGDRAPQLSLFECPAHWFIQIAQGLKQMRGRIKIEACVGDVTAFLEQLKYGAIGHREQQVTYPQAYDRIHLSNVPDYIGGPLTSHLYALQMLHPDRTSYVTSIFLANNWHFASAAEFDAEYVALHSEKDLEKVFDMHVKVNSDNGSAYLRWYHRTVSREYKDLMPRANLQTWLYRLFLKTTLPVEKHPAAIYSPLNLTYFFRLCAHLHSIG